MKFPGATFKKVVTALRRGPFWVCLIAVAIALILLYPSPPEPQPTEFPLHFADEPPAYLQSEFKAPVSNLWIRSISDDGRWACVEFYYGHMTDRRRPREAFEAPAPAFIDLRQKRFIGYVVPPSKPQYFPHHRPHKHRLLLDGGWTPRAFFVAQTEREPPGLLDRRFRFLPWFPRGQARKHKYELTLFSIDAISRQARYCTTLQPRSEDEARLRLGFHFNRTRTTFACLRDKFLIVAAIRNGELGPVAKCYLRSYTSGRPVTIVGWLPDDRGVLLHDYRHTMYGPVDNFYIVSAETDWRALRIPVCEEFIRLGRRGDLGDSFNEVYHADFMGYRDGGRRARLAATLRFQSAEKRPLYRSAIWDLEFETGQLTHVADLGASVTFVGNAVYSPSLDALVAANTAAMKERKHLPVTLKLTYYRIGHPPRDLPFSPTVPGPIDSRHESPYRLCDDVRFLDDHTLIYAGPGYELRKFDLRTSQSELLWQLRRSGATKE